MPLPPAEYARLLGQKIEAHNTQVWLSNTGWIVGPYGDGHWMKLAYTRRMVSAVLSGELDNWAEVGSFTEPSFNLDLPAHIDGVPDQVLKPRQTWADPDEYDQPATKLVDMFVDNFQQFEETVANDIKAAGPSPS